MENTTNIGLSILIARIFATIYLSIGVGLIVNGKHYKKGLESALDNFTLLIIDGFLRIAIGYFIIYHHNVWEKGWQLSITLMGWASLIGGVFVLAFPTFLRPLKPLLKSENIHKLLTPLVLLMGIFFAYFGFFA